MFKNFLNKLQLNEENLKKNIKLKAENDNLLKLEIEDYTKKQSICIHSMKCPICGGNDFHDCVINSGYNCNIETLTILKFNTKSKLCTNCGYILTFVNPETLETK
ncbi:hypothetical protein [Clostridium estertheticum]|uniref:hypothetical protein n=1 Tax=Clostridium estertheticum TaxID=238834 RepID=UPI001C0B8A79|nr:hypothetical protein [Clostridium estertheticum]MBU3173265.1 hypothetical protein [Clostridium estertheticum]